MKTQAAKIIKVLLAVFITASIIIQSVPSAVAAAATKAPSFRGSLKEVKYIKGTYQDEISIAVDNYSGYRLLRLGRPDRFVIDIPYTRTSAAQKTVAAKGAHAKAVRYAQFEKTSARIVIDLTGSPNCYVVEKKGKLSIFVTKSVYKNISTFTDAGTPYLAMPGIKLFDDDGNPLFSEEYEDNKYIVKLPYDKTFAKNGKVTVDNPYIRTAEITSNKDMSTTVIAFTLLSSFEFQAVTMDGIDGGVFRMTKAVKPDRGDGDEDAAENEDEDEGKDPDEGKDEDVNENVPLEKIEITHTVTDAGEQVGIPVGNYAGYNVMRVTSPDRIVIDIPNELKPVDTVSSSIGRGLVKNIRYAQFDKATTRIVIDTEGQLDYDIAENPGQLIVNVKRPTYKNITYSNSGDRVGLLINGAKLTEGAKTLTKFYTEHRDAGKKQYIMTFPSANADIGSGIIKINDNLLNYIEIVKDEESGQTSLIFSAKDDFVYRTITRYVAKGSATVPDDTAITILKPAAAGERLVVIDPGHGGREPGAVGNGLIEKELNLDIALRLNKLLKEHGVRTYMTRSDDSFVGLYERCYIANDLNASLFLSIHNNAAHSRYKGTETIYYMDRANDDSFSGKKFAQIIQDDLVGTLNTYYRRVFSNPNLVVLRETDAPAALAEIAFLTNSEDAKKLKSEEFRQMAAEALSKAILKALDENGK